MPRTTIADACRQRKIDRKDWDEAKRQGIDPWDRAAMDAWLAKKRHRIAPGATITDPTAAAAQTLEQMEDAIRRATDIDSVKILKEKVMALKGIVAVQTETRELVPVGEVKEAVVAAYSIIRSRLQKMAGDLAPRMSGLAELGCYKILASEVKNVLEEISSDQFNFFDKP